MVANRNGFFYVLDRTNGEFMLAKPYVNTTWAKEIGADGRPIVLPDQSRPARARHVPGSVMAAPTSCRRRSIRRLGLFYVTARETCMTYIGGAPPPT